MSTTPRKRPAEVSPETPPSDAKKKRTDEGLWKDNTWFCNCEPPRQAALREVKKAGRNQGKLFWTCNSYPFCDFFLWRDQAKMRETETAPPALTQSALTAYGYHVTPKSRRPSDPPVKPEPGAAESPSDTASDAPAMQTPSRAAGTASKRQRNRNRKRKRNNAALADDSDDGFSDLDSDQERQLLAIADTSARKADASFATPSTGGARRTHDVIGGLPTPSVARTLFPEAKRPRHIAASSAVSSATATPAPPPPPPPSSSPPDTSYDVAEQVLALLRGQKVDAGVLAQVQDLLTTAARRTRGIALGRESARAALKAKDETIAALQERVVALENKERVLHSRLTNVKADLMRMYEEN